MSKVILVGAGDLEVQTAVLVRVIFLSCRVVPGQNVELLPFELLSFSRIVGVHQNLLPLQARTQTELQLKACRETSVWMKCNVWNNGKQIDMSVLFLFYMLQGKT